MATPQPALPQTNGVTKHVNDVGMEKALGIGKGNKRLNTNAHDLQEAIEYVRDEFLELRSTYLKGTNERHDFMRNGLLGEIVSRCPILVYDLPELKRHCDTAFVDRSGKMFISDTFSRRLLAEHAAGKDSLNFLIRHEADHLRRLHLSRMLDFPPEIANIAQDCRINIDIAKGEAAEIHFSQYGNDPDATQLQTAVKAYLASLSDTAVSTGCAMTFDEYIRWDGKSEETIAAELMKDWKEPPDVPNREVSFQNIMEGAAVEADEVKTLLQAGVKLPATDPSHVLSPNELSGLGMELRRIGKAKANPAQVTDAQLQSCYDLLTKLREQGGLVERDRLHTTAAMALVGKGVSHTSAKTGDAYLDMLKPSERVDLAMKSLEMILSPQASNGMPNQPQNGGLTIKDLERLMGRGQDDPDQSQPRSQQNSQQSRQGHGDPNTVPAPTVDHGQNHVMDTEKLARILQDAGLNADSLHALGFDDLDKLDDETAQCKDNIAGAINKAAEDQMRIGNRYPGGHLLNHARAQMLDFFKPVLSWEMAVKRMMEAMGRGQRNDPMEPWMVYHVDHADMGFKSQRDVPFMGSMVPGRQVKPLFIGLHDTSGSVDDAMLKRFISEGINMSRKMSRGNAPDVVHIFADTIARDEPEYITERNYQEFLSRGINYGGRGGTNFQAAIESAFELVRPGNGPRKPYTGRTIDALAYFTDTGDQAPDPVRLLAKAKECGMKKLPTIIFIAPKQCYDEKFKKAIEGWATIVYFDSSPGATAKQVINVDEAARKQDAKLSGVSARAIGRP